MNRQEFVRAIDHSLLKPNLTYDDIREGLDYAREIGAASVCLQPAFVKLAKEVLDGSNTAVCTVIGFPLGVNTTATKVRETEEAYAKGATEMDMVINLSAMKSGDYDFVRKDIEAVVQASPAIVKVILENCYLTKQEIATASKLTEEAGAHYVKTSTGFGPSGALLEDIEIIKQSVSPHMKLKAAGGISDLQTSLAMIEAGCDRIGISRTKAILAEFDK